MKSRDERSFPDCGITGEHYPECTVRRTSRFQVVAGVCCNRSFCWPNQFILQRSRLLRTVEHEQSVSTSWRTGRIDDPVPRERWRTGFWNDNTAEILSRNGSAQANRLPCSIKRPESIIYSICKKENNIYIPIGDLLALESKLARRLSLLSRRFRLASLDN